MAFGGEHHDVVRVQFEGVVDVCKVEPHRVAREGTDDSQAVTRAHAAVLAAGDRKHRHPGLGEARRDETPDRPDPNDDYPHERSPT
jgi:hypothetical protein